MIHRWLHQPPQLQIRSQNRLRGCLHQQLTARFLPKEADQQRRSDRIHRSDLMEAARETPGVMPRPFGFTNVAATFQDALRGKFINQVEDVHPLADQIAPYAADQLFYLKLSHALIFF